MVELIDIILVALATGSAIWFTVRYFINLGKAPKGEAVSCAGCNSSCHSNIPENPDLGILRNLK